MAPPPWSTSRSTLPGRCSSPRNSVFAKIDARGHPSASTWPLLCEVHRRPGSTFKQQLHATNASPVPERLLWVQHLQLRCLEKKQLSPSTNKENNAQLTTSNELKTRSTLLVSLLIPVQVPHHNSLKNLKKKIARKKCLKKLVITNCDHWRHSLKLFLPLPDELRGLCEISYLIVLAVRANKHTGGHALRCVVDANGK